MTRAARRYARLRQRMDGAATPELKLQYAFDWFRGSAANLTRWAPDPAGPAGQFRDELAEEIARRAHAIDSALEQNLHAKSLIS